MIFTFASGPIDHCLLRLQQLDAAGSTLREVFYDKSNPVWQCICSYFGMVTDPKDVLQPIWYHFAPRGLLALHQMSRAMHGVVLNTAAILWRQVAMLLSSFPFQLVGLVVDSFEPNFARTADSLFACNKCCVDRGMTARLINRCRNTEELLRQPHFLAGIMAWSRHRRIGNMLCERLLFVCYVIS